MACTLCGWPSTSTSAGQAGQHDMDFAQVDLGQGSCADALRTVWRDAWLQVDQVDCTLILKGRFVLLQIWISAGSSWPA